MARRSTARAPQTSSKIGRVTTTRGRASNNEPVAGGAHKRRRLDMPAIGSKIADSDNTSTMKTKEIGPPPVMHKRAEDDYNGRLQDLEQFTQYLIRKNRTTSKRKKLQNAMQVSQLQLEKQLIEAKFAEAEKKITSLDASLGERDQSLKAEKRKLEDELDQQRRDFARDTERLQDEKRKLEKTTSELRESLEDTERKLQSKRDECARLEDTIAKQATTQTDLESNARALRAKLEALETKLSAREMHIVGLESNVSERTATKLRKEETMRRQLHNTIQELKGNIRVFCRVRPLLGSEKEMADDLPISFPVCDDDNELEVVQGSENAMGKTTSKTFPFKFDRVFSPTATQDEVFDEVSQLIQSALDGYPVCIFAYGQTGSGKTHTMQGPDATPSEELDQSALGIIPRAVQQIYETTSKLAERGWTYVLEGQFVEIYNETLQDLLAPANRASDRQGKLEIHQDPEGHTRVKNVTTVKVDSARRVHWLLARAAENRTVAATNCNERSSRSHSVFSLHLHGTNKLTGESSSGVLNLIDLAGSERLSSSGSRGERLKETQAINKSLSSLGDVISALAKGNKHVPYRNSKLTHLLQESLGSGNSKTLMFVCVNPSPASTQESLCSLQFATKVNSCHIGTARRQNA
ncbi:kinesin-domain-containing protein [Linderina pennispora]|uniref:Kinesin-like protein n=1 Tax=Linderina pennispora TaxID=61395 RepID=A0A1Y1WJ75_9FUNG|nr:kinesin-domain-containing protein [Linderina pennispora]ORX73543.1 kinesin-domain-containing protein [Linderina pennispora]